MAILKCYNCGNFISDKAGQCPKCGAPVTGQSPQTSGQSSLPNQSVLVNNTNPHKKTSKGIIFGLCAALFLLLAGLVFILIKNNQDEREALAKLTAQQEKEKKLLEDKQAELEAEKARLEEAERQRIEAERQQETARRMAEAQAAMMKSATGVYTGKIYGVRARMSLKQNGSYVSGTYTGNTRKYTVNGSIDDSNYFDLTIYNNSMAEARITGYINGHKMSGTWEEYLTGNIYEFKLMR